MCASFKFRRTQRIRRKRDFDALRGATREFKTRYFTIKLLQRKSAEEEAPIKGPRFGFIASKRVGDSPTRNRAKRRARELCRLHQHVIAGDVDLLFILRTAIAKDEWSALESTFLFALEKLGLLLSMD